MNSYRVFISYAHRERELVAHLAAILRQAGIEPLWDQHLTPGRNFNDQIKSYIEHAHVFAPVISAHSSESVWMHAEIGYALALRLPILPIGIGSDPSGMIQGIQAISLLTNPVNREQFLAEAADKLTYALIESLTEESADQPALFECTEDNLRRAKLLADYAKSVKSIGRHGQVRQKASLTSFHLPLRPSTDRIWETYYRVPVRDNRFLYDCLRAERRSLEAHARIEGCKLIVDSVERCQQVYERHGPQSAPARIRGLLEFLEHGDVRNVEVAVNTAHDRKSSITIVGDWFSSEAISSKETANLREAIFTRNAATVRRQIQEFDREFDDLLKARHWDAMKSRAEAILFLKEHLHNWSTGVQP